MNLAATKSFATWTWNPLGAWRVYPRLRPGKSWSMCQMLQRERAGQQLGYPGFTWFPGHSEIMGKQANLESGRSSELSIENKPLSLPGVSSSCFHLPPSRRFLLGLCCLCVPVRGTSLYSLPDSVERSWHSSMREKSHRLKTHSKSWGMAAESLKNKTKQACNEPLYQDVGGGSFLRARRYLGSRKRTLFNFHTWKFPSFWINHPEILVLPASIQDCPLLIPPWSTQG